MPGLGSTAYTNARAITQLVRTLLNDSAGYSIPVQIVQISRNAVAGVVTVTTLTPHNMVPGDVALIAGVPATTSVFNGTFSLTTSSPATNQFTYAQAGVADSQFSGQVQGYGIGQKWTDSILMPLVNAQYKMLGRKIRTISGSTFIVDDYLMNVPAVAAADPSVTVVINDASTPQLPTNLMEPLFIWERESGSSDDFVEMVNLTDGGGLPSRPQEETLGSWEWRTDGLCFRGALVATQIRLRYTAFFADLTDGTSSTLLRDMREAMAYPTAVMAAQAKGIQVPASYAQMGEDAVEDVLNEIVRQMQHKNHRMRGYSAKKGYGISY